MYLSNSKRYYALNDRTINLLLKGDIDMSATNSETAEVITDSDKEVVDLINMEKEVELFIVEKNKTRAGGSFFPYLNIITFDLSKYGIFKSVDRNNYHLNFWVALFIYIYIYICLESFFSTNIENYFPKKNIVD